MLRPLQIPRGRRPNGISLGILATVAWMLMSGMVVQHRHNVPPIAEFKGSQVNVGACAARDARGDVDVQRLNDCLDLTYARKLADWRSETGTVVILPPMLLWVFALLFSLASDYGVLGQRRDQRA